MQVSVTFRNIESTEALKAYAEEKLEHVRKVVLKPLDAHVILSVEKFRHTAEVTITANGETLVGIEETEDMYKSIDKVMDKLTRQARRSKEKAQDRRRNPTTAEAALMTQGEEPEGETFDDEGEWSGDVEAG